MSVSHDERPIWSLAQIDQEVRDLTALYDALEVKNSQLSDPGLSDEVYAARRIELENGVADFTRRREELDRQRSLHKKVESKNVQLEPTLDMDIKEKGVASPPQKPDKPAPDSSSSTLVRGAESTQTCLDIKTSAATMASTPHKETSHPIMQQDTAPPSAKSPPSPIRQDSPLKGVPQSNAIESLLLRPEPSSHNTISNITSEQRARDIPPPRLPATLRPDPPLAELNRDSVPPCPTKRNGTCTPFNMPKALSLWASDWHNNGATGPVIQMWHTVQDLYYKSALELELARMMLRSTTLNRRLRDSSLHSFQLHSERYQQAVQLLENFWSTMNEATRMQLGVIAPTYDMKNQFNSADSNDEEATFLIMQSLEPVQERAGARHATPAASSSADEDHEVEPPTPSKRRRSNSSPQADSTRGKGRARGRPRGRGRGKRT